MHHGMTRQARACANGPRLRQKLDGTHIVFSALCRCYRCCLPMCICPTALSPATGQLPQAEAHFNHACRSDITDSPRCSLL
jgi:hypothetical protein